MKELLTKKNIIYFILGIVLITIVLVVIFYKPSSKKIETEDVPDAEMYIKYTSISLKPKETKQLEVFFSSDKEDLIYSSEDDSIATISEKGLITAIKDGVTMVEAITPSGKKVDLEVIVQSEEVAIIKTIAVSKIDIKNTNLSLTSGATYQLVYTVLPTNATDKSIMWETNDARIATVNDSGLITARMEGNVVLNAYYRTTLLATINVSVKSLDVELTSLELAPSELTISKGESFQLSTTYIPSNVKDKQTIYSSSNSNIVSVDGTGKVTAKSEGVATITAISNNVEATATVTVGSSSNIIAITSLSTTNSINLNVGATSKINVTYAPSDATNKSFIWTTSNSNIATVDRSGNVKGVSPGSATITCKSSNGKTSTTKVTVATTSADTEVLLSFDSITLEPGQTKQIRATILPLTANQSVTWFSGQESVATVSSGGLITAVNYGKTTISALSSSGKVAKATIIVSYPDISPATAAKNPPSGNMTTAELEKINNHLRWYVDKAETDAIDNGTNPKRARVMAAAYWLVYNPYYRVQYVWGHNSEPGAKTNFGGWNPEWSNAVGVECQNFVMWVLWQAGAYDIYPTASILQHSPQYAQNNNNFSVQELIERGVEPGDIIRRSRTSDANGHWAIVMTVNKEECYIEVAHASDPNSDTLMTRYNCGVNFRYQHLYKLPAFYGS